ncbi:MAG: hypothetical protein R3B13_16870 [Polyangiaceae bacterium]
MMVVALSPQQEVELQLVAADANDLVRAHRITAAHPQGGILVYAMLPLMGFFAEESYRYLRSVRPELPTPPLFCEFRRAVTKARAGLKLFDDNDGYADGVIDLLKLAHEKSVEWFCEPHVGPFRRFLRRYQPDLGVFFVGEDVTATSHASLPAFGVTRDELRDFTPADLDNLGARVKRYSYLVGDYTTTLASQLMNFGLTVDTSPEVSTVDTPPITHNDFIGAKFYDLVRTPLEPIDASLVAPVTMAAGHINSAIRVLPALLGKHSNLLLRAQLLTAYHAGEALRQTIPHVVEHAVPVPSFLCKRPLRNVCAHYGLRGAGPPAVGTTDPFCTVVQQLAGVSGATLRDALSETLERYSEALRGALSKSKLATARARLGANS